MALIARGTKQNGTTSWADGDVLYADELNLDIDTAYTELNGNLDDDNIDGSAAINASKIDDHSDTVAMMRTETNPGVSGSESVATTLEGELQRLRYILHARGLGTLAAHYNGTTLAGTYWGDQSVRGPNLCRNGSFEVKSTAAGAAPDGWATVGTPTTLEQAATDVSNGTGYAISVVSDAADEGFSQTFAGLKASTSYFITARYIVTSGSMRLVTTGADAASKFRNVDIPKTDATWSTVAAVIVTDGTPADIVVKFISAAGADAFKVDNVELYEMGREIARSPGSVFYRDSSTNAGALGAGETAFPSGDQLSVAVTVPGPGYTIRASAALRFTPDGATTRVAGVLNETPASTGVAVKRDISPTPAWNTHSQEIHLAWLNASPTPGETYTYTTTQLATAATGTANGTFLGQTLASWLLVELVGPG